MGNKKNARKKAGAKKGRKTTSNSIKIYIDLEDGLEEVWDNIEDAFKNILNGIAMPRSQYMCLYDSLLVYLMKVEHTFGSLESGKKKKKKKCVIESFSSKDFCNEIYSRLAALLLATVEHICEDASEISENEILSFYDAKWKVFRMSCLVLNGICRYLNDSFVLQMRNEGYKNFHEIYQCAMTAWKHIFIIKFANMLTPAALKLIEKDRKGELVNTSLVSNLINSYIEVDINGNNPFFIYEEYFENDFIITTAEFYTKDSSNFLLNNSVNEYMKRVNEILRLEEKRIQTYFHTNKYERLKRECEEVLIGKYLDLFNAEFTNLLDDEKIDDLAMMYLLLTKVPNGLDKLPEILEKCILNKGLHTLETCADIAKKDTSMFFNKIIDIHQKFKILIKEVFSEEITYICVLDKACARFINNNAVTKAFNGSSVISELLAKHCDSLLKKNNKNFGKADLEDTLTDAITVFKYIDDKDVFRKFYIYYFKKRLLNQMSTNNYAESSMISKLRQVCGWEYTSKMHRMFEDIIKTSPKIHTEFRMNLAISIMPLEIDLEVKVLSSGIWNCKDSALFNLPREIVNARQRYEYFFTSLFPNRTLTWVLSLSQGELETNCFEKKYTFQVSIMQMTILMMYNNCLSYTVQKLQIVTGIEMVCVIQVLKTLLKSTVLSCDEAENLQPTSIVSLYTGYNNIKLRVNMNVLPKDDMKALEKTEIKETEKDIEKKRNFVIQAAIVRIMKVRKKLKHQELIVEVSSQLSDKFKANALTIKNCISLMIDKEYMKRCTEENNSYEYIA